MAQRKYMNTNQLRQKLEEEGFVHIFEWNDSPNMEYEVHSHKGKVAMYILSGDVVFDFGKKVVTLKKGDRFDVPVGEEHIAKVGPNGCSYIVGEMIEGDS